MPLFIILLFLGAIGVVIAIASLERQVSKLNKVNAEQARAIQEHVRQDKLSLSQLNGYLTQNPLAVYKLLEEHVNTEKKRQENNR